MKTPLITLSLVLGTTLVAACGDDDSSCDPVANTGCDQGLTCEVVQGGDPACFEPVVVRGNVFDSATTSGISGARVVALDVNGAPVSSVAITDMDGNYNLSVPTTRSDSDGTPVGVELTLRADAEGYATFPSGLRQALPVDTGIGTHGDGEWTVQSPVTDIALNALMGAGQGSIHGVVAENDAHAGVLVVAESGGVGYTGVADTDGDYAIYNLPDGDYTVKAYAKGFNYTPGAATIAGDDKQVDLSLSSDAASDVSGSVQIVNGGNGTQTSIILVPESTYDDVLERGTAVPGLRAPDAPMPPTVTGAWTITGVPAGNYVVLAAFENDFLVRDRSDIGGTATLHITVVAGMPLTIADGFKVTGALDVISPGANGAEMVASATPDFTWMDDSSEDMYHLTVFDTFGNIVWEMDEPGHSGDNPVVTYAGPALVPGLYYQFRAASIKTSGGGGPQEISRTEDLKGVFFVGQ